MPAMRQRWWRATRVATEEETHGEAADVAGLGDPRDHRAEAQTEEDQEGEAEAGDRLEFLLDRLWSEATSDPEGAGQAEGAGGRTHDDVGLAPHEGGETTGDAREGEDQDRAPRAPGVFDPISERPESEEVEDQVEEEAVKEACGCEAPPLVVEPDMGELEGAEVDQDRLAAGEGPDAVGEGREWVARTGDSADEGRCIGKHADGDQAGGRGAVGEATPPGVEDIASIGLAVGLHGRDPSRRLCAILRGHRGCGRARVEPVL
jgi:hypothetical protein